PAFGIGILLPDLLGEQSGPAVGAEPARQRHAVADLERLPRLRRRRGGHESTGKKCRHGEENFGYRARKSPGFNLEQHLRSNQPDQDRTTAAVMGQDKSWAVSTASLH